jgi:signal transduction histidine kinase
MLSTGQALTLPAARMKHIPVIAGTSVPALIRQRSWWWLPLLLWAGAVGLSLQSHLDDTRQQSIQVATEGARNMFRMVALTRGWNASHGGVYVPVTPTTQPNPYLKHPRREVTTTDGVTMTLINPAYMTRLIAEMAQSDSGAIFRLTSLMPVRPQNAPDDWERRSLQSFENGVKEVVSIEPAERGDLLRYMAPLRVEQPCMQCHAQQGYRVGDIRGGISVSLPYTPILALTLGSVRQAWLSHGAVFALVAALGWLLLELLRKRWLDLTGKMRELEATRGELVQSEKMASLGRMVAGFAHEINTPVGVAVGAVSQHEDTLLRIEKLLGEEEVSEEALRAELDSLRQGGALALANLRRTATLVQSFKRTSIDQTSEQVRAFSMKELIGDVLYVLQGQLKRLPITVGVECPEALKIHGVPGELEQLLTNLIMNAAQHAFDGGQRAGNIRICAQREGASLHLSFSDDGAGMSAEQLLRIFEPFYTTRRAAGGSGLGLYICYNLVTVRLDGTIQCFSSPGAGCRFEIRFPAQFSETQSGATA